MWCTYKSNHELLTVVRNQFDGGTSSIPPVPNPLTRWTSFPTAQNRFVHCLYRQILTTNLSWKDNRPHSLQQWKGITQSQARIINWSWVWKQPLLKTKDWMLNWRSYRRASRTCLKGSVPSSSQQTILRQLDSLSPGFAEWICPVNVVIHDVYVYL